MMCQSLFSTKIRTCFVVWRNFSWSGKTWIKHRTKQHHQGDKHEQGRLRPAWVSAQSDQRQFTRRSSHGWDIIRANTEKTDQTVRMRMLGRICFSNAQTSHCAFCRGPASSKKTTVRREANTSRPQWSYHYENMPIQIYWKFYHQKMKVFRWKILIFFIFLLKTLLRGGSNGYPHSMFFSSNKKNNVYPCKPQFYYIKVGFKEWGGGGAGGGWEGGGVRASKLYRYVFVM